MKNPNFTIEEVRDKLFQGEISAVEVVKNCLEQIKKFDKEINAFITVLEKEALDEAREADKEIVKNKGILKDKPLLGIPIGIKDLFCTKGVRTTAASKVLEDYIPVYDATSVDRLRRAGAIFIGKNNLDAWAHGSSGENSDFGSTKNPWNIQYVPGGSSSGSAAAVCLGMALAATGTDTGGSIRLPASFCNLVGLKPTYGRVSRYGVISMASSLDTIGHFTRTVADSALFLGVTAGFDGKDSACPDFPVPDYLSNIKTGIGGVRIGIPKEYLVEGMNTNVKTIFEESVNKLQLLGAEVKEVSLPNTEYANAAYYLIQTSEVSSNLARYTGIRYGNGRERFGEEAKRRIMLGTYALSSGYYDQYYLKAQKVRTLIQQDFKKAFLECDILVSPVSPTPPFKLGEKTSDPLMMYLSDILTVTANLAGIPALSVPAGFIDDLPVGIQFLGPQFSEELLFRTGFAFEQNTKYFLKQPVIFENEE